MDKPNETTWSNLITPEIEEQMSEILAKGLDAIFSSMKSISEDTQKFDKEFDEQQKTIKRGGRRRTGRIV